MDANEWERCPSEILGQGFELGFRVPGSDSFPVPAPRSVPTLTVSPPSAPTAASAAAAARAVSSAESAAGGSFFPGAGDIDGELASAEVLAVKLFDGILRLLGCAELDEREAAGAAGLAVEHDVDAGDHSGSAEVIFKFPVSDLVRKVAHEEPAIAFHNTAGTTASYVYRPAATRSQGTG